MLGVLGLAGISGLLGTIMHQSSKSSMDEELRRRDEIFKAEIEKSRAEANAQAGQITNMIDERRSVDPIQEIDRIIGSYNSSGWNKFLQQEATQGVEGLAADQGLLSSARGLQMIQNQSALSALQGMSPYVSEALKRRSDLDNQVLNLANTRASIYGNSSNSSLNALTSMYNNAYSSQLKQFEKLQTPNIFDATANTLAGGATGAYLRDKFPVQEQDQTNTKGNKNQGLD